MNYEQFAERCAKVGKSPSAVAIMAGFSRGMLTPWKQGKQKPYPSTMLKLEKALNNLEIELNNLEQREKTEADTISENYSFRDLYPRFPDAIINRVQYGSSATPPVPSEKTKIIAPDNSMIFDCIPKDAEVTCRKVDRLRDGSLVAFHINGENLIRRVSVRGDEIILGCSNPRYTPSCVKISALSEGTNGIWGEVISVTFDVLQ